MRDGTPANGEPRQLRNYSLGGVWHAGEYDILEPLPAEPPSERDTSGPVSAEEIDAALYGKSAPSEPANWWMRKCAEVEMERDKAVATMKHERATCLADARAKEAVLAERARVNGWWMAWRRSRDVDEDYMTSEARDAGIASGAPAPGGVS
jgi:hypothetical protein